MLNFDLLKENNQITKKFIEEQAELLVQPSIDGSVSPLEQRFEIRVLMEILSKAEEKIKVASTEEASKIGDSFEYNNCLVCVKDLGTKYDYSSCPNWVDVKAREDIVAAERKCLEEQIRKGRLINESTGEVYQARKYSTRGLTFGFKNE